MMRENTCIHSLWYWDLTQTQKNHINKAIGVGWLEVRDYIYIDLNTEYYDGGLRLFIVFNNDKYEEAKDASWTHYEKTNIECELWAHEDGDVPPADIIGIGGQ